MPNQRRTYGDFVNSDCGNTFAEYIGIVAPRYEFIHGGWRMTRWAEYGREMVQGEVKPTKKEAKASYKEALARHRASLPKRPAYGCLSCFPDDHCPAECVARNHKAAE